MKMIKSISYVAYDNSFDTGERAWNPEIWAAETLAILEENMVVGRLVHTDFSNEIAAFGDTVNTRKPGSFTARRKGTNDDVTNQDASATKVPVVLNQHPHTSFLIRDGEESRSFKDLVEEYLKPAAKSLAEHVDRALLSQVYQFRANQVASDPDGTDDIKDCILDVRQKQNEKKVPMQGRNMILTPKSETEALKLDLFISADKLGDEGTAMREASLGRKLGYDTYMCQNTPGLASGTSTTTATGAEGSVDGVHLAGDTTIVVHTDATTPMSPGMYVTFEDCGGVYRVTAVAATLLTIDQGLLSGLADDSKVTYYTEGVVDLAGDTATTTYPIGYVKQINITAAGVIPQVGQLVAFATSANVLRTGEYGIIAVDTGSGAGDYYITLDRPLDVALENIDKVHYGPAVQFNFAFDRPALALVCRPLALPRAGTGASAGVASYNDLAMRVVITYDGVKQGHRVTLDLLCGVKVLDADRGAMMVRA
jgi:hypothetical protein